MSIDYTTYFAYGAKIADTYEPELTEAMEGPLWDKLQQLGVNYLWAGDYDRDGLYLTAYCKEVKPGEVRRLSIFDLETEPLGWDFALRRAATLLEVELMESPAWFVMHDVS
jgi:hypothetical protein